MRVIPPPPLESIEIDAAALAAALARLAAASTSDLTEARLSWSQGDDAVSLDLSAEPGVAVDSVPAVTTGSGAVAVQPRLSCPLLAALRVPRAKIGGAKPGQPARIEPADGDTSVLALLATMVTRPRAAGKAA